MTPLLCNQPLSHALGPRPEQNFCFISCCKMKPKVPKPSKRLQKVRGSVTVTVTPLVTGISFYLDRILVSFNVSRPHFTHALTSALYALAAMLRAATPRTSTATVAAAELAAAGAAEMLRVNHLPRDVPVPAIC